MFRAPRSLKTQATAPPCRDAVRSAGKGALKTCSRVNACCRGVAMFRIAASASAGIFQDIVTSRTTTVILRSEATKNLPSFAPEQILRFAQNDNSGTLPPEQLDESPAIGRQLGGADPGHFRQGFERTGPERSDRRECAVVEDDVWRDGPLRGFAPPPHLQRLEENVIGPVGLFGSGDLVAFGRDRASRLRSLRPPAARYPRAGRLGQGQLRVVPAPGHDVAPQTCQRERAVDVVGSPEQSSPNSGLQPPANLLRVLPREEPGR